MDMEDWNLFLTLRISWQNQLQVPLKGEAGYNQD